MDLENKDFELKLSTYMMLIRLKNWTMNIFILKQKIPESVSVQPVLKGSPLYPGRQEQIGR